MSIAPLDKTKNNLLLMRNKSGKKNNSTSKPSEIWPNSSHAMVLKAAAINNITSAKPRIIEKTISAFQ